MTSKEPFIFHAPSAPSKRLFEPPVLPFSGNGMAFQSRSINADLPEFLIRQAAEKERNLLRSNKLVQLKSLLSFQFQSPANTKRGHFHLWEELVPSQESLRKKLLSTPQRSKAMFVKEAEDIWLYYQEYQGKLQNMEILSLSEFTRQYQTGFIAELTPEKNLYPIYRCFTSKNAYYKSRINNAGTKYDEFGLNYINEMKLINDWEEDMLIANKVKSDTMTFQSEELYDRILENWEAKARPLKVNSKCNIPLKVEVPEAKPVSTVEIEANTTNNSEEAGLLSKKLKNKDPFGKTQEKNENLDQDSEEIDEFIRLWDKYKHNLEEILVQRRNKQLKQDKNLQSSSDVCTPDN